MKSILNFLIIIFVAGFITTGFTGKESSRHSILIQSSDKNISSVVLTQSAGIITERLKDLSSEKFDIVVIPENKQIRIVLDGTWDLKAVESLLLHKGTMSFYETYDQKALAELLNGDSYLFSLLKASAAGDSGSKIGCSTVSEISKVSDYLKTLELERKCRFAWTQNTDSSGICLFALKITGEKGALINDNDIDSVRFDNDKIDITLKGPASASWAEATRRNMNKAIAIVLDDNVISAPTVRSVIESGKIEITGRYSQNDSRYLSALLNNGKLQAGFHIVK